jgi:hypothetical protein
LQQHRNCFCHRTNSAGNPAKAALAGRLFGEPAVGNKSDGGMRHNRPTVIAGKAGYVCNIGGFSHDETIHLRPRDTVADAFEPGPESVLIHIAQSLQLKTALPETLINTTGRKNKVFFVRGFGEKAVFFLCLARGRASH